LSIIPRLDSVVSFISAMPPYNVILRRVKERNL
jgi:hypothetical protein